MALRDQKITADNIGSKGIAAVPDKLVGTPAENKALFDRLVREVVAEKVNAIVDALTAASGAGEIGAEVAGIERNTVQGVLSVLKALRDADHSAQTATNSGLQSDMGNRYTKAQVDAMVGSKFNTTDANLLVKSIAFNADNGVFTITTQGGSVTTIDTMLGKVPASFALENDQLVLTLEDGTKQTADLSAFVDTYTFSSSETVEAVQSGKELSFMVKDQSVTAAKLAPAVTQSLSDNAVRAETAREGAETARLQAVAARDTAQTAAAEANTSKLTAADHAAAAQASQTAAQRSESYAAASEIYAAQSAKAAQQAQAAAETAALSSKQAAGGDFATPAEVEYAKTQAIQEAAALAAEYTDTKAAEEAAGALDLAKLDATGKVHAAKTEILAQVDTKAGKSTLLTMTLKRSGWVNGCNDLFIEDLAADSNVEILPGLDITAVELEALQAANLQDGGQQLGRITLKAFGTVPGMDLPIRVIVRGDN